MRLALGNGVSTPRDRFHREYVAMQMSLLSAPAEDQPALASPLGCYLPTFPIARLFDGAALTLTSTLGDLIREAEQAAGHGTSVDLDIIAAFLGAINSNDPGRRCGP